MKQEIKIDGVIYQIDMEAAKNLGVLKEKKKYPTWEDFINSYPNNYSFQTMNLHFHSQKHKEEITAFNKILIMRDLWVGDWVPKYKETYSYIQLNIHGMCTVYNMSVDNTTIINDNLFPLTFPTEEMANDFIDKFGKELEVCKRLI